MHLKILKLRQQLYQIKLWEKATILGKNENPEKMLNQNRKYIYIVITKGNMLAVYNHKTKC